MPAQPLFARAPRRVTRYPVTHKEVSAASAGTQAAATVCGLQTTIITVCAADDYSVRLPSLAELDGVAGTGGLRGEIWNRTAFAAACFPPSGKKIYLGNTDLTADTSFRIEAGACHSWVLDNDGNYTVG